MLIGILQGCLYEKLDLAEFETENSDCRFGTFRSIGISKFETITIKGNFGRYCRK
jgi:hypothetical protein